MIYWAIEDKKGRLTTYADIILLFKTRKDCRREIDLVPVEGERPVKVKVERVLNKKEAP